jgi:hypothetical protein
MIAVNTFLQSRSPRLGNLLVLLACGLTACRTFDQTSWEPGKSYFGRSDYVEYIAGDLPLIISAPHGGTLRPAEIPDRKGGEFTSDANTEELARTVQKAFYTSFGHRPHIIICRLDRRKVDCNREIAEGAGANAGARQAWTDYQQFIETAQTNVIARYGKGFYIDLHGQSHAIKRIELGYCLSEKQLVDADELLNQTILGDRSPIRSLVRRTGVPFSELLRGTNSLGALLAAKGYPAVPSPNMPTPKSGEPYFGGGYNVRRHGSMAGGPVDGVQMEVNYAGLRDSSINRARFAAALAQVFDAYFARYYDLDLKACAGFRAR